MSASPTVRCPNCSAVLRFRTAPKPTAFVTCPVCKMRRPVGEYVAVQPAPAPAPKPTPAAAPKPAPIGRPGVLVYGGCAYPLQPGRNVVGRRASSSSAGIMLPDESRYMSREHLTIEVESAPDGSFVHVLSLYKDFVQPTWVNSTPLMHGERITLRGGDKILIKPMGGEPIIIDFVYPVQ